jgi:hypothetical protein
MIIVRLNVVIFAATIALTVSTGLPAAETACKSSWFGYCTSYYSTAEQAQIDADKRFMALLKDPIRLLPELERRLRKQVRYDSGALVIKDQLTDSIRTFAPTVAWSVSCDLVDVFVDFGDVSENGNGISLNLTDFSGVDTNVCQRISGPLGAAVQRLTRGQ